MQQWKVGIFLFNEVEVLDFAGPYEVFSTTTHQGSDDKPFDVKTIAQTREVIRARNGLQVIPDLGFPDIAEFDILIIPGGYGAEEIEIHNEQVIAWIQDQMNKVQFMTSVCTGAFLLARAGLLEGRKATTHWADYDRLTNEYRGVEVIRDVRFVDQGDIITAGGISSGINMSFYLVAKLLGEAVARNTAKRMEYEIMI